MTKLIQDNLFRISYVTQYITLFGYFLTYEPNISRLALFNGDEIGDIL
jgi:hypothetical protein